MKELIKQFKKTLETKKGVTKEHRDYILIKELYHCSPSELDNIPERQLNLHYLFLMEERNYEYIESKRNEQRTKQASFRKKKR